MVNHNKTHCLRLRTALSATLLLAATSASAMTVDGNLNDLISAVGLGSVPLNAYLESDPLGSTDSPVTESNNGFDIENVYSFYDVPTDTLYLGMNFWGTVGNSSAVGASGSIEGSNLPNISGCPTNGVGNNSRSIFDCNEQYTVQLFKGTSVLDPMLLNYKVVGVNTGSDAAAGTNTIYTGLTVTRSVSEANNGVEFSIAGLYASGALPYFSPANPVNLLIGFRAGSADTTGTTTLAEDTHYMQTQVVPIPAAAWLFGSGLIGLVAAARKCQKTA